MIRTRVVLHGHAVVTPEEAIFSLQHDTPANECMNRPREDHEL